MLGVMLGLVKSKRSPAYATEVFYCCRMSKSGGVCVLLASERCSNPSGPSQFLAASSL